MLPRPKEAKSTSAVSVLRDRHLVDDHVSRIEQKTPKQNAARLFLTRLVLGERIHLLDSMLDNNESLSRRNAEHKLHIVPLQRLHGRPNTRSDAESDEVCFALIHQLVVRNPSFCAATPSPTQNL